MFKNCVKESLTYMNRALVKCKKNEFYYLSTILLFNNFFAS